MPIPVQAASPSEKAKLLKDADALFSLWFWLPSSSEWRWAGQARGKKSHEIPFLGRGEK